MSGRRRLESRETPLNRELDYRNIRFRTNKMENGNIRSDAVISPDGRYRYKLVRYWAKNRAPVIWIMLNPSTADDVQDDATIRRCISFAKRWGFGGIEVYNLFALRSRYPVRIQRTDDPIGPENDRWLKKAACSRRTIVVAWGRCGTLLQSRRAAGVMGLLARYMDAHPVALGLTRQGSPKHPLYVPNGVVLRPFLVTSQSSSRSKRALVPKRAIRC